MFKKSLNPKPFVALHVVSQVYRHALGVALAPPSSEESDIVLVHRAREWLEEPLL